MSRHKAYTEVRKEKKRREKSGGKKTRAKNLGKKRMVENLEPDTKIDLEDKRWAQNP